MKVGKEYKDSLNIKASSLEQIVGKLSGGNQQKVSLGKWLFTGPKILILDEPTRGIDVGAKFEIYTIMNQLIDEGMSIIMISSELGEVLGMSDRIYVMAERCNQRRTDHEGSDTRKNYGTCDAIGGITMEFYKEAKALVKANIRDYGMYIALIVIMLTFTIMTDGLFMSSRNISNLLDSAGYIAVLAVGMTLVIVIRHIDLSVGFLAGFLGAITAIFLTQMGVSVWITIPIILILVPSLVYLMGY